MNRRFVAGFIKAAAERLAVDGDDLALSVPTFLGCYRGCEIVSKR
jgi:hypothetical protein